MDQNQKRVATIGIPDRLDNEKILSNKARYSRDKQKDAGRRCKKQKLEVTVYPINEKRHTRYTGKYVEDNDSSILEDNISSICGEDNDPDWDEDITRRAKYYREKTESNKVNISIDKDTFLDNIALMADKTFTSSRIAVQIAAAALSTAGDSERSEISRLTISHRTLHRKRDDLRISNDKLITENWRNKKENSLFLLHWDEKTLRHLRQVDGLSAYMAVVLTDLLTGEEKILSIIEMVNSKAEEGVSSVIKALQQ